MQTSINQQNNHSILRILMVMVFAFHISACNTSEKAAKMIQKKASQFCMSQKIGIDKELHQLECIISTQTISESITEKTELMSSW